MDIELRLLQCALALAEHSNFARAAKTIHMSQPSLSRNIQELERRLGVQLFSRDQRRVEPTSAGEIFLEQAREIVSRADDLVREMNLLKGMQKGDLNIGAGIYPGPMFVDKAIGKLIHNHPATRMCIYHAHALDLIPRVLKRELDLAILYVPARGVDPQLHVTKLNFHPIHFVARDGHPLAKLRRPVSITEALQYPLVGPTRIPATGLKRFASAKRTAILKSGPSIACESLAMMKPILAESNAIALLPLNVALPEIENGTFALLAIEEFPVEVNFSIVRMQHRSLSPLGEKLVQLIIEGDNELTHLEQQASVYYRHRSKKR
jgi:DNA-binding transcriptional LysR family regulator